MAKDLGMTEIEQAVSDRENELFVEIDCLKTLSGELVQVCEVLVKQFEAYPLWLGKYWRIRIGLPFDLQRAKTTIAKAREQLCP